MLKCDTFLKVPWVIAHIFRDKKTCVGDLHSLLLLNLRWGGHNTDHGVMQQEEFYLPAALFMA